MKTQRNKYLKLFLILGLVLFIIPTKPSAATTMTTTLTYTGYQYFSSYANGNDYATWSISADNIYVPLTVMLMSQNTFNSWVANGHSFEAGTVLLRDYHGGGTVHIPNADTWYIVVAHLQWGILVTTVTSTVNYVHVDDTAPTITITSPSRSYVGGTQTIAASISDPQGVDAAQYRIDSGSWILDYTAPYQWSWNTQSVPNGVHTIYVGAWDNVGNYRQVTRTITVDNTLPSVSIVNPQQNAIVSDMIYVLAVASDNYNIDHVSMHIDSGSWISVGSAPYQFYWDTIPYSNGQHTITVRAYDLAGNTKDASITVTVDNSNPFVQIHYPYNNDYVGGTITIDATATDNNGISKTQMRIDSGTWIDDAVYPYSWTWDTTTVADGAHTITVRGIDLIGNYFDHSIIVFVDNTKPNSVVITNPNDNDIVSDIITIDATIEDNFGIFRAQYSVDSGTWYIDSSSPYSWTLDTKTLTDRVHTITVVGIDYAGNSNETTITIFVDNTAPSISITNPTDNDYIKGSITITTSVSDINEISTVQMMIDGGDWIEDVSSPYEWSWDSASIEDGIHLITVEAYDIMGNSNDQTIMVTVDNTNPSLSITTPTDQSTISGTITISADADDNIGISQVQMQIDSGSWIDSSSSPYSWTWDSTSVSDGNHQITIRAYDAAGNSVEKSVTVSVDNTNPSLSIINPPDQSTVRGTMSITATASDNAGISKAQMMIDGGSWIDDVSVPFEWTWDSTSVIDGIHLITVRVYDNQGNYQEQTITVTVDNTAPSLSITNPTDLSIVRESVSITATASDNIEITKVQMQIDGGSWLDDVLVPFEWTWDSTSVSDGNHQITIRAYDAAGNYVEQSISLTVDNTAPSLSITNPTDLSIVSGSMSITAIASDNIIVAKVQMQVDGGSWLDDVSVPFEWTWDSTSVTDGNHLITIRAYDGAGNLVMKSITLTVDNTNPSLSVTNPTDQTTVRDTISITATATDDNGIANVQMQIDGGTWLNDVSSPFEWTWDSLAVSDGDHQITIRAYDAAGNHDEHTISVTVDNTPPTISISNPSSDQYIKGEITITTQVSDVNGIAKVQMRIDENDWLEDISSPFEWTWDSSTVTDGEHEITIQSYDSLGNYKSKTINVIVDNTKPSLSITNPTDMTKVNKTITITATATDNVGVVNVKMQIDDEDWIDDSSSPYSWDWNTSLVKNGEHTITVRAYDAAGNYDEQTITVLVLNTSKGRGSPGFEFLPFIGVFALLVLFQRKRRIKVK